MTSSLEKITFEDHELDAAIRKTGNDIKDVTAVIIGHLHLDHAGGLEHFRGTRISIYAHELEFKNAFYSVATKTDIGEFSTVTTRPCFMPCCVFRTSSPAYINLPYLHCYCVACGLLNKF